MREHKSLSQLICTNSVITEGIIPIDNTREFVAIPIHNTREFAAIPIHNTREFVTVSIHVFLNCNAMQST